MLTFSFFRHNAIEKVTIISMAHNEHFSSSILSRYFALSYSAAILLVSLYPWTGWHMTGIPVFDFYTYPLPYYYTFFDNILNLIAYIPLGFTVALCCHGQARNFFIALIWGFLLSASIEFMQQFLPTRIASNLDIISNTLGTMLGALLAIFIPWRTLQLYLRLRYIWLRRGRWNSLGVVWLSLWVLTQLDPSLPIFSLIKPATSLTETIHTTSTFFFMFAEISNVCLHILTVALFASCLVKPPFAIAPIVWLTFALGFFAKIISALMLLPSAQFFAWLNVNVILGGFIATGLLTFFLNLSRHTRALLATITVMLNLLIRSNITAANFLYPSLELFDWPYGHLTHFIYFVDILRQLWPYGALLILLGFVRESR